MDRAAPAMTDFTPEGSIRIRPMRADEVSLALRLTVQSGWNQTAADWARMHSLEPRGCFAADLNGSIVGTTVCCVFDKVAWLALVLVEQSLRNRGIGRRLVERGLEYADDAGAQTVRLDATPLGRPIYERLGFQPQFELERWGGTPETTAESATIWQRAPTGLLVTPCARAAVPADVTAPERATGAAVDGAFDEACLDELLALDRRATRTDRAKLLRRLFRESPPWAARDAEGQAHGFLGQRAGRLATQIGPCSASSPAAERLLTEAFQAANGRRVIVDLPPERPELGELVRRAGLAVERKLLRMCRGVPVIEDSAWFQVSSGPMLG